jgi:hypothetical protein
MPQYPVPGGGGATKTHQYYSNPDKYGEYQFVNLDEIIDNFTAAYVGDGKILGTALKADVTYHAHRAMQELHYDTLKSCKSQEIILPPSLTMRLPHDYVNYTKITWSDANGIEHIIYPASKTSKGNKIQQDSDGNYLFVGNTHRNQPTLLQENKPKGNEWQFTQASFLPNETIFHVDYIYTEGYGIIGGNVNAAPPDVVGGTNTNTVLKVGMEIVNRAFPTGTTITQVSNVANPDGSRSQKITLSNSAINFPASYNTVTNRSFYIIDETSDTTAGAYKSSGSNQVAIDLSLTTNPATDSDNYFSNAGERYGIDPQYAQNNGSFFIDCAKGLIHFSSNLNGKKIILHYLSDGHGDSSELIIHKFAEEAMYKWIAYGCASARVDVPEGIIQRLKREKFAETRKAKIRLSNIKIEEITQLMRGKSKFIKH